MAWVKRASGLIKSGGKNKHFLGEATFLDNFFGNKYCLSI
jgi:hypothetical protein